MKEIDLEGAESNLTVMEVIEEIQKELQVAGIDLEVMKSQVQVTGDRLEVRQCEW